MKVSSAVLYAAAFFGFKAAADAVEHRQTSPVVPVEELSPCNGAPDQYDIPVNYFPWLGTSDIGADSENVKDLLYKGIRLLDLKLCKQSQGQHMAVCSADGKTSEMRWQDVLDTVLNFARAETEQIIVINLDLKEEEVETMEDDLDIVCKVHAERTEGTKVYETRECPFVYTLKFPAMHWPSLGELVNYDPQMAQWEGDGELVGVRSKVILTYNGNMLPRHRTSYLSKKFWTAVDLDDSNHAKQLKELCSNANAVGLRGAIKPETWENALFDPSSCNINEASARTFINVLLAESTNDKLLYLKNLQSLLVPVNYAKWQGQEKTVLPPSTMYFKTHEHDEL